MITLRILPQIFAVCKLASADGIDLTQPFVFVGKTDDELSLVCEASSVPSDATIIERDWRGLKVVGTLDFGLIGIIAGISDVLAKAKISLFVVSTYNTDYVLVKSDVFEPAIEALAKAGYGIEQA